MRIEVYVNDGRVEGRGMFGIYCEVRVLNLDCL